MMSPSDKVKEDNSSTEVDQTQEMSKIPVMNTTPELSSTSASNCTIPGTIASIPLITASLSTLKCSINDQMKTFDPGEDSGNERLSSNQFGNSVYTTKNSSSIIKGSNKNYKAGSKINKLADMLAKRSQNVVEVSQNNATDILANTNSVTTVEESVSLKNVSDIMNLKKCLDDPVACFNKTATNNELDIFKKSRRKSVPNQSFNLHQMHLQSTSKSCSDFSKLFLADENETPEFNALGVSLITMQTDESTKRKAIRKNLKNVELTLILPEKKRRSYARNVVLNNKIIDKQFEASVKGVESPEETLKNSENPNEIVTSSVSSPNHSVNSAKVKKESRGKKRKSKRLVESSTQTADLEFITVVKPQPAVENSELNEQPIVNYNCLYCTQTFALETDCRAHEKTHVFKNSKQFIKCQYCSKKLPSLEELKLHCVKKHPNKYAYCMKCDYRFSTKEKLYSHNKEVHLNKSLENVNRNCSVEKKSLESLPEKKKEDIEEKQAERKNSKQGQVGSKTDLKIDVSYDSTKKSSVSPRNIQKCSPKEIKTEEQLLEMEMLFYSQLSGNIQENLTNHLDGKIDKNGNPVRMDQVKELVDVHAKAKSSNILSLASPNTGAPDIHVSRAPSPYQTRSKTPNPLPPTAKKFKKLPNWQQKFWEKYNFPTNYRYEHRFWDKNYLNTEKSAFYLKDLSCLDIKTQLIMRESIKKLDNLKIVEENAKPGDKLKFPDFLSLVPKENCGISHELRSDPNKNVSELKGNQIKHFKPPGPELAIIKTRRKLSIDTTSPGKKQSDKISSDGIKMITRSQSSIDLLKEDKDEDLKKKVTGTNTSESQRMTLRRQTSLDNLKKSAEPILEKNSPVTCNNLSNTNDTEIPSISDLPELSGEWVRPRIYLCGACCTKFTNLWELEDHKWVSHPNVWCTHYEFEDEKIENLFQISEDESRESNDPSSPSNLKLTDLYKRYLLPHGSLKTAKLVPSITFPEQCTKCKKSCMNSPELHKHMLDCGGDTSWFLTMYSSPMTIKRRWRPFGSRRRKQLGRRDLKRNLPNTPTIRSYPYRPRIRTKPGDMESIQKMLANLPEKRARRVINFDEIKTRSQATIRSNRLLRKRFKSTFATNFLKLKNLKQRRQLKQRKKEGSSKSTTDASSESTPIGSPKRKNRLKEGLQVLEDNSTEFSSENSRDSLTKSKKRGQIKPNAQSTSKSEAKKLKKKKNPNEKTEKPNTRKSGIPLIEKEKSKIFCPKEEPSSFMELQSISLNEVETKLQSKNSFGSTNNVFIKVENISEICTSPEKQNKKSSKKDKKKLQKGKGKSKNGQSVDDRSKTTGITRHQAKEKIELPERMENKLQSSKRILENKESQPIESGKRRSLRIKFQQASDHNPEADIIDGVTVNGKIVESHLPQQDTKNSSDILDNFNAKNSSKSPAGKSFNEEKDIKHFESNCDTAPFVRRSSRSSLLRNSVSLEEKIDFKSTASLETETESLKSQIQLRRNSNSNSRRPATSSIGERLSRTKTSRAQNVDFKSLSENLDSSEKGRQMTSPRRNLFQNSESSLSSRVKVEMPSSNDRNTNSDLEEMPILAKVEPIRGKANTKNENEIPVLMPVDKKPQSCTSSNEKETNEMILQVSKKRRNATSEMMPIKIIKTGSGVSLGKPENSNSTFASRDNSVDNSSRKIKKKKLPDIFDQKIVPIEEKRRRSSTEKKYFLGICPGEIDKGKEECHDESGSDSEPLIALLNHNQKPNPAKTFTEEQAPVLEIENIKVLENKISEPETEKVVEPNEKQDAVANIDDNAAKEKSFEPLEETIPVCNSSFVEPSYLMNKTRSKDKSKKKKSKKKVKRLSMTLTLKEPTLKIETIPLSQSAESLWTLKVAEESINPDVKPTLDPSPQEIQPQQSEIISIQPTELNGLTEVTSLLPKRRSRRISKETKSTNEFIIDDPLILVDELWSELDSDSDSSKKKSKKGKKKLLKKKGSEDKKTCDVNLEELLRNFGENKEAGGNRKSEEQRPPLIPVKVKGKFLRRSFSSIENIRKSLENRVEQKSYKRLSLKLFQFNKSLKNFGNRGWRLCDTQKVLRKIENEKQSNESCLPDLPFLATEIKENPVQVIQCRAQKSKTMKRGSKKPETKCHNNIRFKVSLPLESISNVAVFNNNHLTELVVDEHAQGGSANPQVAVQEVNTGEEKQSIEIASEKENHVVQEELFEMSDVKSKTKRSEVIDKIFYCEICQTYYYSSSQLKIHKQSNRHKLKESELQLTQAVVAEKEPVKKAEEASEVENSTVSEPSAVTSLTSEPILPETVEIEKLNDDTLEMPTLEGPFIENTTSSVEPVEPAPQIVPPMANLGFTQESLKDIQRAIGCTDEEMLILTLLGENTLEVESDILDLNSCKSAQAKNENISTEKGERDSDRTNGVLKIDLKQRMTSALSCLVNKAVFNLLRKYESMAKSSVNPEALTLLGKLSSFSRRKNVLQLNDLLKKQKVGEPSIGTICKDLEKKVPTLSYKYQCTICGNRFEKASTREFHISRTHKSKAKKLSEKTQFPQPVVEEEWNDSWNYEANEESLGRVNNSQFWCSDCGINFLSPQEVLQHQKVEHQAGVKELDRIHETGPLQSSTIGSSDEIIEEIKPKRRPKLFSSEELDQQRILATNELRKLDRKYSNKNKTNKIKWGMDALRFTVEKENKMIVVEEEKEDDAEKSQNLDLIPKLNLSRTNNIPEFKVIQKNSLKNRFQKIIDNKLKRRSSHQLQEPETDVETEVMLVPVVVKKKNKKFKRSKSKKDEGKKNVDVYDFNDSESENEPVVFSRVKKPSTSLSKLKLVKAKETPSKNKADSTTKHLVPDDYDSEDSLPLSIVKKSKPEFEEDDKEEKILENGVERSDGILEQVEYLIEQLENETIPTEQKKEIIEAKTDENVEENREGKVIITNKEDRKEQSKNIFAASNKGLRVSLTNKLLEFQDLTLKSQKDGNGNDLSDSLIEEASKNEFEEPVAAEPESNHSTFDEEDSIPLVHISKKFDESKAKDEQKKSEENITDASTIESEDTTVFFANDTNKITKSDADSPIDLEESLPPVFLSNENDEKKSSKSFETLNGNVIYCRNDSISDFESDLTNDELIDSSFEKAELTESCRDFVEVTEKEDVVIVCSKADDKKVNNIRGSNKRIKSSHQRKDSFETNQRKKKRIPLLTATIEENNFRKSESPKLNKEVIVRKIWNRRKLFEETVDDDSLENIQNDESQTEIDKEFIMKKIWSRKKLDLESENEKVEEKLEDVKINQTEISDEVIIKCGPKTKTSPKRRKSRGSTNECAKETIMRKIWSGKCTFQTKAALKTYDSDMIPNSEENEMSEEQPKPKKRGRPSGFSATKRSKIEDVDKDDEDDDLDSLLEEIEREQLEKAIRSEFLQMRRSEKGNVEILKEGTNPTVGIFAETGITHKKNVSDRKKKKLKKNRKHPRQSLLTRRRYLKKPTIRRVFPAEEKLYNENSLRCTSESLPEMRDNFLEKKVESFSLESKVKSRKHKKHRHKHHHHKHKHKKSKHRKCILNKHKNKHKFSAQIDSVETTDSFTILEKICQDIPNQIESETHVKEKLLRSKETSETNSSKIENLMSPFSFEDSTKDCEDDGFDNLLPEKSNFQNGSQNICDFVEDISNF